MINNKNKVKSNSDLYHINTRQKCNFHQQSSNLSLYQKGVKHKGLYSLPQSIKNLSDNPKSALKNYLYTQSPYHVEEYFNINTE